MEGQDFTAEGVLRTVEGAQGLWERDKYHFQKWAVEQADGFVTTKRSADGGIDGRVYFAVAIRAVLPSIRSARSVNGGALNSQIHRATWPSLDQGRIGLKTLRHLCAGVPDHVRRSECLRDRKADKPAAAGHRVKVLRRVFAFGVEFEHVERNPARDIPLPKTSSQGFHWWSVAEVQRYEARHPIGTQARLAFAILLYTGHRVGYGSRAANRARNTESGTQQA